MMRPTVFSLVMLATTTCGASRYTILTVPAISMTNASFEADYKPSKVGKVEAKYCNGDPAIASHDSNIGLIDEAVAKAERQSGAQYLKDVTLSREGGCVVVEGTAMK
jgi:hypothetical protein